MFFLFLNFLIAFLSFVAFIVTINSSKKNEEPINYYFLIILLGLTIQRFFYSSSTLFNITIENKLNYSYIAYFYCSLFYLFIKKNLKYKITLKENLAHFTLAFIFILINVLGEIDGNVKAISFFIFSTIYLFLMLKKSIFYFKKERKYLLKSKKRWLFIMLFLIILFYLAANLFLVEYSENISSVHLKYYNFSALIWLIALTYLFVNPEIFFGLKKLKEIIRTEEVNFDSTWSSKPLKKIQAYDQEAHAKVVSNALNIISKIKDFSTNYYFNNNTLLNFNSLADGIEIQKYHLNYIFKYYCVYSKSDFFNYCKVLHILKLIEDGYLQNKTVSSLISDSHFKSKKTFYNNFQKFTGKNPQQINNALKFNM
jgi:methylphosphotriester-DNA--protein-cysteine methyltransferase